MRLPFAVYTAQQGYGWVSGLEHGRATLERYRKALGKLPEFDFGDPLSCGAVNSGDTVVAYRFLKAEKWDFRGRDALYIAITFFPRAVAGEIDFERLLGMEVFTKPLREPPAWLDYGGGGSAGSEFDPEADAGSGTAAKGFNLSNAGIVFKKAFAGTFRIWRKEGDDGFSCTYTPPAPVIPGPVVCNEPGGQPAGMPVSAPSGTGVPVPIKTAGWRRWGEVAAAAVMVGLVAGYVLWMKTGLFRSAREKPVGAATAEGGKPVLWSCWPVGADGRWRGLGDLPPYGACCEVALEGEENRGSHD